jgi:(E)-4-hydroxy-3-methylbut-2-enyl-diphosphate synthase
LGLVYVPDPYCPHRRATREVKIGDVGVGAGNPIRVQSMTTTDTQDVRATADQVERLAAAGCEIVRITAPSIRDAEALGEIRALCSRRGVRVPLVADIHFTPNAAMTAAELVEKVRVNPGNYADRKRFEVREYSDAEYAEERERVADRFRPLVRRLRELGRALRIGTNHGSLSDRVMNRYGDTPLGMVESALEFLDVCEAEGYRDVVFSMKASNAQVAIQAYRLLAARLDERRARAGEDVSYPFHLGVTEAGDGEDGRIKSAIGIGALLEDGIGDTLRVSLTEDPVKEVPVARALAARYDARSGGGAARIDPGAAFVDDPYSHRRRATRTLLSGAMALGAEHPVRVELALGAAPDDAARGLSELRTSLALASDVDCEGVQLDVGRGDGAGARAEAFTQAVRASGLALSVSWCLDAPVLGALGAPALEALHARGADRLVVRVRPTPADLEHGTRGARGITLPIEWCLVGRPVEVPALLDAVLDWTAPAAASPCLFSVESELPVHAARALVARLRARGLGDAPVVLRHRLDAEAGEETALLHAATDLGALLCDGIGDAVTLGGGAVPGRTVALAYRILQGARLRTSWTEFISCPSCGRTLFDLETTTARIKARTGHLKGVKIAIMGCIVNGPGEMADADFGYVGSGVGRVNLYVGKDLVERNVPEGEADGRLVDLIKKHGAWIDPGA